jgi:hypothetical protein
MKIFNLKAKNFYSFRELNLDINDYKGIVRISGKNKDSGGSNGSGKSSIFEAIVFGIFGKTIKKSTEESLVNTQAGKDCKVSIAIEKNGNQILIERTKRPTSLNLFVNGDNKNKEAASETQKVIEELLQTDYKSFLTSTAFGCTSGFQSLQSTLEGYPSLSLSSSHAFPNPSLSESTWFSFHRPMQLSSSSQMPSWSTSMQSSHLSSM